MITLTNHNGRHVMINPTEIISIIEGSTTQRSRGIQSVVRTTDKEVFEVQESMRDIQTQLAASV